MIIELIYGVLLTLNICIAATWLVGKIVNRATAFYYETEHYYG